MFLASALFPSDPLLGWMVTLIVSVGMLLIVRSRATPSSSAYAEYRLPPVAPGGLLTMLRHFKTDRTPEYLLDVIRTTGQKIVAFPVLVSKLFQPPGFVMVADAAIARRILDDPKETKVSYHLFDLLVGGDNFMSANGHRHRHVRKATAAAFAPDKIAQMIVVVEDVLSDWIERRGLDSTKNSEGVDLDMSEEMEQLSLKIIGMVGFDYDLSQKEIELANTSLKLACREWSQKSSHFPHRKVFSFLYPEVRRAQQASRDLVCLARRILESYREKNRGKEERKNGKHKRLMIDYIVNDPEYDHDDQRIRDILILFATGFDTTSHTITWTLMELARNPDMQRWLRSALQETQAKNGKDLTTARRDCPALRHTIRESMRYNTTVAVGAIRQTQRDVFVHETKIVIPKNTTVFVPTFCIHRDADVYDKPDEFWPQRWSEDMVTEKMQRSWMSFGSGRRQCLGQALANAQVATVLAKFCLDYEWSEVNVGHVEYYVTRKQVGLILRAKKVLSQVDLDMA